MKSRFGAALEPFTYCNLIVFEKGGDRLSRVNQADIVHSYQSLREDWHCIESASRMVDLVSRITPEAEPNAALFHLLRQGLASLEKGPDRALSTMLFVNDLLSFSGYQPRWDQCMKCHQAFKPGVLKTLYFSPGAGGALCASCASRIRPLSPLSQGTRAFLLAAQRMDYVHSHRLKPSPLMRQEIDQLFKDYLAHIIGKSRQRLSDSLFSRDRSGMRPGFD